MKNKSLLVLLIFLLPNVCKANHISGGRSWEGIFLSFIVAYLFFGTISIYCCSEPNINTKIWMNFLGLLLTILQIIFALIISALFINATFENDTFNWPILLWIVLPWIVPITNIYFLNRKEK
jgi:hypothetical protein